MHKRLNHGDGIKPISGPSVTSLPVRCDGASFGDKYMLARLHAEVMLRKRLKNSGLAKLD